MPDVKRDAPGGPDAGVDLPDHPDDLRQYCVQLLAEIRDKTQLIEKLTHELVLFRRYLYGRRSERLELDPAQLLLEFASWLKAQQGPPPAEPPPALAGAAPPPPPPRGPRPPAAARGAASAARRARAPGRAVHVRGLRRATGEDRRGDERAARLSAGLAVRHRARPLQVRLPGLRRVRGDQPAAGPTDRQGPPGPGSPRPGRHGEVSCT